MEKALIFSVALFILTLTKPQTSSYSLTVKANGLENSKGSVIFALYNKDGSIPDEHFKAYFKKKIIKIEGKSASHTFDNLPEGRYAVAILHDENNNEKLDKKFMLPLPKEGVGFSNYDDFGLSNRPNFKKARFKVSKDTVVAVKIIYK